jgi:protein-disulfide isomerase
MIDRLSKLVPTLFAAILAVVMLAASPLRAEGDAALAPDMELGNPEAKVTLIEYASFTCPHCAAFHAEVLPRLRADYIDQGLVRFVYREVYFDRYGLWAAMVARCGGPERFFGLADMIYAGQQDWARAGTPADVAEGLRRIGRVAGLDDATLDACLTDQAMAEALVAKFESQTTADEVQSTPTLIINGVKHSNMPYDDLRALIDTALAE